MHREPSSEAWQASTPPDACLPTPGRRQADGPAGRAPTYVVGIGASAGGLEAIEQFFAHMPLQSGMAFVIVQHLSPDFKSLMDQILGRHTAMPIRQVESGMRVEADTIYLIPPRQDMVITQGCLSLSEHTVSARNLHLPIDTFFASLAADARERAIGIILSGTGSDGTRGIRAIKDAGGLVLVQDIDTAKFDGMPRSALNTGVADAVLAPAQMPTALSRYVQYVLLPEAAKVGSAVLAEEEKFAEMLGLVRQEWGVDFAQYKQPTISRRLLRRMGIIGVPHFDAYLALLRESAQERYALYKNLLIGVTHFFRDPEAYTILERDVMPILLRQESSNDPLRLWVSACSTGEEVYSLAMLLREQLDRLPGQHEVKLFATDVDKEALEFAAQGVYPESIAADVGPERLLRFFTKNGSHYQVTRSLREMIIFAGHDLIKDPPFTRMHFISCRNFLIYLEAAAQQKVLAQLHYALRIGGFLWLGPSEMAGEAADAFRSLHNKWRVLQKIRDVKPVMSPRLVPPAFVSEATSRSAPRLNPDDRPEATVPLRAYTSLAATYCPPALVTDVQRQLLWVIGDASAYLQKPSGPVTTDVVRMVVEDLSVPLATALHKVAHEHKDVVYTGLRVRTEHDSRRLNLHVTWVPERGKEPPLLVVSFAAVEDMPALAAPAESYDATGQSAQRIRDLEQTLQYTQENLQATIEELATSNEELQSTNEELLAANEELQSTNEELHSANEELYTVNAEYQNKIQELIALHDDLDNLLRSTAIGTVFLDTELRIRSFTPAMTAFIPLLHYDIGRPLGHFTQTFAPPDFLQELHEVMRTRQPVEREIQLQPGAWWLMRVLPFLTSANTCMGVVLTCTDISQTKHAQEVLQVSQGFLHSTLDALTAHVAVLDETGVILSVNAAWRRFAEANGWHETWGIGMNYLEVCDAAAAGGDHDAERIARGLRAVLASEQRLFSYEYPCHSPQEQRWFVMHATRFADPRMLRIVVTHEDSTEFRRAAEVRAQLAAIVESSTDAIIGKSLDGTIMSWNGGAERIYGYTAAEAVGRPIAMVIPPERLGRWHDVMARVRQGERVDAFESEPLNKAGDHLHVAVTLSPVEDAHGQICGVSAIVRDITAHKRMEEELARQATELVYKNQVLEELARITSHSLQEPLRQIVTFSDLLRRHAAEALPSQFDDDLRYLTDGVKRMRTMVQGLLEFSQVSDLDMQPTRVPLEVCVDAALQALAGRLQNGGVRLARATLPEVRGNQALLTRLYQSLLENALTFRGEEPPRIRLTAERQGEWWRLGVWDNGIGLAPEYAERIFLPFARLHNQDAYEGIGIGLAICRKIVERHGGRIWVESQPDKGATFFFTLPVGEGLQA